ncbi:MAG: leucine-rich repeat domain-containing protein, partial [Firmicutes bacterium]|nr:leucine-rich repeat domain-containing protein [Bacillota bacterium]
ALPASVTEIGAHAFNGATSLTDIIIPHGVTTIRDNTFSGCSALASIVIPASVTQIQSDAFRNCNALTTVYYGGESAAQFNAINTGNNAQVVNATRYYYSEIQPATQGNYWHFEDGVPTAW